MAPNLSQNTPGSTYNTPESQLESVLPVHPIMARRPHAIVFHSENTTYIDGHITAKFFNHGAEVNIVNGQFNVTPLSRNMNSKPSGHQERLLRFAKFQMLISFIRLMMIGLGSNNGTTLCVTILTNRHNIIWHTKADIQHLNYTGHFLCASAVGIGAEPGSGQGGSYPHL